MRKPPNPLRHLQHQAVFVKQSMRCLPFCNMSPKDEELLGKIYEAKLDFIKLQIAELEAKELNSQSLKLTS